MRVTSVAGHPVDLSSGSSVAPGKAVELPEPLDPHDQRMLDGGALRRLDAPAPAQPRQHLAPDPHNDLEEPE